MPDEQLTLLKPESEKGERHIPRDKCHFFKPAEIVAYKAAIEVLRALGLPWNFNVVTDTGFSGDRWSREFSFECWGDNQLSGQFNHYLHVYARCVRRIWIATAADCMPSIDGGSCFRFRWLAGEIVETVKVEIRGEIWESEWQDWNRRTYEYNFDTHDLAIKKIPESTG